MFNSICQRSICLASVAIPLIAISCAAAPAKVDAPHAVLHSTSATLAEVLTGHRKAQAALMRPTRLRMGTMRFQDSTGTFRQLFRGGDYVESYELGGRRFALGKLRGQQWNQDSNGVVTLRDDTQCDRLVEQRGNLSIGTVALVGETAAPDAAYVIEVRGAGGCHEWAFYDKQTFLTTRSEQTSPAGHVIETFSYHRVGGTGWTWWRYHRSDGYPINDEDIVTTTERLNIPINRSDLDIPHSQINFVQFPQGKPSVQLATRLAGGRIIATVMIAGYPHDFELASESAAVWINLNLAKRLGLQMFGEWVRTPGGEYYRQEALLPEMQVGDLIFKNLVVGISSSAAPPNIPTIQGGLGFDFIASAVFKIDYRTGAVQAIPPQRFVPPAHAVRLATEWADATPRFAVRLNGTPAKFILATGFPTSFITSSFRHTHPEAVTTQESSDLAKWILGLRNSGDYSVRRVNVKSLRIGSFHYTNVPMFEVNRDFVAAEHDGILGNDQLNLYTVYIDYNDRAIYLI